MARLEETDVEDWEEIGERLKHVNQEIVELIDVLSSVPKSVWQEEFEKASGGVDELKDVLDDRFAKEHPEEFEPSVFYGQSETDWD